MRNIRKKENNNSLFSPSRMDFPFSSSSFSASRSSFLLFKLQNTLKINRSDRWSVFEQKEKRQQPPFLVIRGFDPLFENFFPKINYSSVIKMRRGIKEGVEAMAVVVVVVVVCGQRFSHFIHINQLLKFPRCRFLKNRAQCNSVIKFMRNGCFTFVQSNKVNATAIPIAENKKFIQIMRKASICRTKTNT